MRLGPGADLTESLSPGSLEKQNTVRPISLESFHFYDHAQRMERVQEEAGRSRWRSSQDKAWRCPRSLPQEPADRGGPQEIGRGRQRVHGRREEGLVHKCKEGGELFVGGAQLGDCRPAR